MLFSQIIGQEKAKLFLKRVMAKQRIPHAYLFTGIQGIGKTSTAKALTMALNCHAPEDFDACGACPPCRQMLGGNFPDFILIKPEGQNIKIEQIRELNRNLGFAPVLGRHRVCVLQQAEAMTGEAANAFLKTLEEPPPGNILVLNVAEPLDLLPTIVSRCQRVPFQPLPVQAMIDWLVRENHMENQEAAIVAKASDGSLVRALRMSEDIFLKKRKEWLTGLLNLPHLSKGEALEMAVQSANKGGRAGADASSGTAPGLLEMLAVWACCYRDLLLVKVGGPTRLMINVDLSDKLKNIAGNYLAPRLIESLFALDQASRDLRRMRNASLVMEHTILRLQGLAGTGDR